MLYNKFTSCLYMFRAHVLIIRRSELYYTASGIITLIGGRLVHETAIYVWCQWIFIDIKSFRSHYGPAIDSASNRNEYLEYFLGVKVVGS